MPRDSELACLSRPLIKLSSCYHPAGRELTDYAPCCTCPTIVESGGEEEDEEEEEEEEEEEGRGPTRDGV